MSNTERHRDGQRMPGGRARLQLCAAKISALATCAAAHGGLVDINGGSSWSGWNSIGNSRTNGMWMSGSTTRNYSIYATMFTLEASQTVGGSRIADGAAGDGVGYTGDSQTSLFSGSWRVGDRIAGVGLRYADASQLRMFFFMVDWTGDSMRAASSVGAADGKYGANTGDVSIRSPESASAERFRAKQYSIANGVIGSGGNAVTPYGTTATIDSPGRGFAVLADGSASAAISAQFFINLDAIARSNDGATFGEGVFGPTTKLGLTEAESSSVFSQQTFSVPTPGAMALFALAVLTPAHARSRRRC